jgi:hypothetical protein
MKYLSVILLVILCLGLTSCFDGDDGTTTTVTSNGASTPVLLASGTMTVGADSGETIAVFAVGQPGQIDVAVEWSTGPSGLLMVLQQAGGPSESDSGGSPLSATLTVTQDMLDTNGTQFSVDVANDHLTQDAEVTYTVTFTPSA